MDDQITVSYDLLHGLCAASHECEQEPVGIPKGDPSVIITCKIRFTPRKIGANGFGTSDRLAAD